MQARTITGLLLISTIISISPTRLCAQRSDPAKPSRETAYVPSPSQELGFTPGDDFKLASWDQVVSYFEKLAQASDRVEFQTLGKTSMGAPFVMATISAPENLARLDHYKRIQTLLADPRKLGATLGRDRRAGQLINRGKTVVLITCGIHSTEVGSYLSSFLIAYRLATSNEPEIKNILQNTIVLLVPALNPDGVDIVKNWYDKTLRTPYEGTSPPELYHKYVGHDDNRDWYAFTQVETQITVEKIHNFWRPQIVHDIHQQGEFGSRLFLPPYMPPVEPNVPKQLVAGYTELGNWMARELRGKGFQGITTNSTYDAWTPARAYSHYHGGVRILSETASARIASPITVRFEQLRSREGYDPQKESERFGPVWRGGEWRLRDITNYMTTAAFTLLRHAAENRERWLRQFYGVGEDAVRPRRNGELVGYKLSGRNISTLLDIFDRADVEYRGLPSRTRISMRSKTGVQIPASEYFVPMAQPYGNFAKALLEKQIYPNLRDADGHPVAPYDVTAHTMSLLTGVEAVPVYTQLRTAGVVRTELVRRDDKTLMSSRVALYKSHVPSMDEGWTRWLLEQKKIPFVSIHDSELRAAGLNARYDVILIPDQAARTILNGHAAGSMPPEYTGGMGDAGVRSLREFVERGGSLVFLNRSSIFAIEQFKLPVRNVVAGLPRSDFFVPGSILRVELDTSHPLAEGMSKETIALVEDSPVFELANEADSTQRVRMVARYPHDSDPLLSGWLLGGDRMKGKAALISVAIGQGQIILFGFRPQYRAQSLATYPLLFNALRGTALFKK